MITNEVINKSIEYIMEHINEDISIEDVAKHCHFSKYYFSRVFKAETGQSIYSFIKDLKMNQSALRLKIEKGKTITDIGLDYGDSSSNFSTVFKRHHRISPIEYRKKTNTFSIVHPLFPGKYVDFKPFKYYDNNIKIQNMPDNLVIYERHIGNYEDLGKKWSEFIKKYESYLNSDSLLIERSYDDPSITNVSKCMYDICISIDNNTNLKNVMNIRGGTFLVYRFNGFIKEIFNIYQGIFNIWLPNSGYEIDDRYGFDIYRFVDNEKMKVIMDLCIPIKDGNNSEV